MGRGHLAAAVVALAALVVSCGVSTNEKPKPIDRENLPSELVETDAQPYDSLPSNPQDGEPVSIWFLKGDSDSDTRLHYVIRRVPLPADAALRLETLLRQGPTPAENQDNISTAIPSDATLTQPPELVNGVLRVSLSDNLYDLRGESSREAFAQIVYTVTEVPSIEAVQFELDGEPVSVPDGDGESHAGPLGRGDYSNLRANDAND